MHKFTCSTHTHTDGHIYTGTYTCQHLLKVSTEKPILSLLLCTHFPTVLVFFTPPVAMCHRLPSPGWSQSYLQTVLRKIWGQKCALSVWNVEQKYHLHTAFDISIHFGLCRDTSLCMLKMTIFCLTGFSLQALPFIPLTDGWPFCFASCVVWAFPCNSSHHIAQAGVKCYIDDLRAPLTRIVANDDTVHACEIGGSTITIWR